MAPHRTLGLALAAALLTAATTIAAALAPPAPALAAIPLRPASQEEKKRVPKREKPQQPPTPAQEESQDEEDGGSDCLFDCFSGLFDAMFFRSRPEPAPAAIAAEPAWSPGEIGEVPEGEEAALWDGPGGAPAGFRRTGTLHEETLVSVVEVRSDERGRWLRVRPVDEPQSLGWIAASALVRVTPPPSEQPARPRAEDARARASTAGERWQAAIAVGGGIVGPTDLNLEYEEGGFRVAGQFLWRVARDWHLGGGVGFRNFEGNPRALYVTSTAIDDARNSSLELLDLGLRGGQRLSRGGVRLTWLAGWGVVRVSETADIHVLDPGTLAEVGRREESLALWRGQGDLGLALAWPLPNHLEAGFLLGGYVIHWNGSSRLSLTSDFLGKKSIHGFDVALHLGFGAR